MTLVLEKNWSSLLKDEIDKPYFADLKEFLRAEIASGKRVYPPFEDVFAAFRYALPEDIKVVIVGQDPYHGEGQAEGLCFSVKKGIKVPPSLKNIYKELASDIDFKIPDHGSLVDWAKQGVLLLNATLTVREAEPKSHYGQGWERFTDAVIEKLCKREDPIVFLLWGRSAQEKCERILDITKHPHLVLKAAHPSPFSATKFLGCRHFSKANQALEMWGKKPINWQV